MSKLALLGGTPIIDKEFSPYSSIGEAEKKAVNEVLDSGTLSGFYGSWDEHFLGGEKVKAFEKLWAEKFNIPYAVSVNSNTSGLYASMAAIGISPGDEVIVSPYTMSATAVAPLGYGGIPVFADIEPETFCLDPVDVEQKITPRTKAIFVTNIFGHPARLKELRALCDKHNLYLIEDAAQSPWAKDGADYSGTIGDIGIYSLNYHKHIHTGEGGMCVTRNQELAQRLQMVRNHAEAVVEPAGIENITNMYGQNYRMSEMSAAVGIAQLSMIDRHIEPRVKIAEALSKATKDMDAFKAPIVRDGCNHVYYIWAGQYDGQTTGVSRSVFSKALKAEGFPHFEGYLRPLYLLPLFQQRKAMGRDGFPFNLSNVTYEKGMCPIVEDMYYNKLIAFEPCAYNLTNEDIQKLQDALIKVYDGIENLKNWEKSEASKDVA